MSDNFTLNVGSGGDTLAGDDVGGGVKVQRVKTTWGPDGTMNDADVASGKALPIQVRTATGLIPLGEPTDAKSSATDGTSVTAIAILKQISAECQVQSGKMSPGMGVVLSVTRPSNTTVYAANDVVGITGGGTAGLDFNIGAINAASIMITSVSLEMDRNAVISGETSYILHLYNVTPPSALTDNDPFDLPSGDRTSYLGAINLGIPVDLGSTLFVETNGINKQVRLAGTHIFGYLVTVGGYTPTSAAVHKIVLHAVQL